MNPFKFIAFNFFLMLFVACGSGNTSASSLFEIQVEGNNTNFQQNQSVGVAIKNKKEKSIGNITYSIDDKELQLSGNKITLDLPTLGNKILKATISYDENTVEVSKKIKVLAPNVPELYTYEIIKEYPHDIKAYTQGLEFYNGVLYESTGKKGRSSLRKVDYKSGKVLKQIDLENTQFGEGITIMNNKIYQLTWQNKMGFVYDLSDFKKTGSFQYGQSKEGWGLCNDGKKIFKLRFEI